MSLGQKRQRRDSILPSRSRNTSIVSEGYNDDERERSLRRSDFEQSTASNNANVSKNSSIIQQQFTGQTLQDHFNICLQMFVQNKINSKNVWQIQIFEYMSTLAEKKIDLREMLQVAGTSFDIGAKVYSLRVDNIYDGILKLARELSSNKTFEELSIVEDINNNEEGLLEIDNQGPARKRRKLSYSRRSTIIDDENALNGEIPKKDLESSYLSDVTGKYLNFIVPIIPNTGFIVKPLSKKYYWSDYFQKNQTEFPIEISKLDIFNQSVPNLPICPSLKGFSVDQWSLDDDNFLNTNFFDNQVIPGEENGIPLSFMNDNDVFRDDNMETSNIDQSNLNLNAENMYEYITDMSETFEKSLNFSITQKTSDVVYKKFWAGPEHWKFKPIHHLTSTPKKSANPDEPKSKRTKTVISQIDFNQTNEAIRTILINQEKSTTRQSVLIDKRLLPEKLNINQNDILSLMNIKATPSLFNKSNADGTNQISTNQLTGSINEMPQSVNNEPVPLANVDVENYDDNVNSSSPNLDDNNDDFLFTQFGQTDTQDTNGIKNEWAKIKAKKINMKKLKQVMWEEIFRNKGLKRIPFSKIFKELPKNFSKTEMENISGSVAFVALLHLANEQKFDIENISVFDEVYIIPHKFLTL